jgi:hypothetical protein
MCGGHGGHGHGGRGGGTGGRSRSRARSAPVARPRVDTTVPTVSTAVLTRERHIKVYTEAKQKRQDTATKISAEQLASFTITLDPSNKPAGFTANSDLSIQGYYRLGDVITGTLKVSTKQQAAFSVHM